MSLLTCLLLLADAAPIAQPTSRSTSTTKREGNDLRATPNDVHGLVFDVIHDYGEFTHQVLDAHPAERRPGSNLAMRQAKGPEGAFWVLEATSQIIETPFPFNEVLPSWNADVKPGAGFAAQMRVGRGQGNEWSPYYYLGSCGTLPKSEMPERNVGDDTTGINTDYFQSRRAFDRIQYRFVLVGPRIGIPADSVPAVRRVTLAYSNTLNDAEVARRFRKEVDPGPKEKWARRLAVPYRSQEWEDRTIRGKICSPTCVAMLLEYRGVKQPTMEVCRHIYDPEYRIYGNWWRAVQGAYSFGVPGYLERFGDWNAVKRHIANDEPIIASIKVKRGELHKAPYHESDGHLIVVTGFTEKGNVCVNDPAAMTAERGRATYAREDVEKIWLANGGVGYVIEAPRAKEDWHPTQ